MEVRSHAVSGLTLRTASARRGLGDAVASEPGAAEAVDLRPIRAHFAQAGPADLGEGALVEGDVRGRGRMGPGTVGQPPVRRVGEAGAPRLLLVTRSCGSRRPACPEPGQGCPPAAGEPRPNGLSDPRTGGPVCGGLRAIRHPGSCTRLHRDPRWGEAAALRVGRVDLQRRRLSIDEATSEVRGEVIFGTPKTHKRRVIPFPAFLTDPLAGRSAHAGLWVGLHV
jgi:hypothetical protein